MRKFFLLCALCASVLTLHAADKITTDLQVDTVKINFIAPDYGDEFPHYTIRKSQTDVFNKIGTFVLPSDAGYEITQYFYRLEDDSSPAQDMFMPGTTYKVTADVKPLDGYSFPLESTWPDLKNMTIIVNDVKVTDFSGFGLGDGFFSLEIFFLTSEAPTIEALDPVTDNPSSVTHKAIKDGQLLILRDGKTYTATGLEMR